MNKIAVIIPFYQREKGLLTQALLSVLRQSVIDQVAQIIVVDDESPTPARIEIDEISHESSDKIVLIEQVNGGVSNARNSGLNAVATGVEYVAFLDPDDTWLSDHLALSLKGLELGSDFHFSNFTHIGQSIGAFERAGYLNKTDHQATEFDDVYVYQADILHQITTANVIGTTSVVYRFAKYPNARFDEGFTFAGEDYLMWIKLTKKLTNISFTSKITANCGEGINLFSGAPWGSAHLAERLINEIQYRSHILNTENLKPHTREFITTKIKENKKAYRQNLMSMLKRLNLKSILLLIKHLKYLI